MSCGTLLTNPPVRRRVDQGSVTAFRLRRRALHAAPVRARNRTKTSHSRVTIIGRRCDGRHPRIRQTTLWARTRLLPAWRSETG